MSEASKPQANPPTVGGGKGTGKRDSQLDIERKIQKLWMDTKPFDTDPSPDPDKEKFFVTFPYPYMNGVLHLGHAFSLSKAEFAARFQRLLGKQVLFPFGFHCTGMPIAACADRLKQELLTYGNPPNFPPPPKDGGDDHDQTTGEEKAGEEDEDHDDDDADDAADADGRQRQQQKGKKGQKKQKKGKKGKKTKAAAKTSAGLRFQYEIMQEMGVPESEIPKFQDPVHWLKYFPPIGVRDLQEFGLGADFRRSFITTDVNPYYDAFIRWQFNRLNEKGKLSFGKRPAIWSPIDRQPCADHDRSTGEGLGFTEYTLVKIRLQTPYPPELTSILETTGRRSETTTVILPGATLRPETSWGQTNLYMLPSGEYGVFRLTDQEVIVCSERSALNMSYQEIMPGCEPGKPVRLGTLSGSVFMGYPVQAPLTKYERIFILPLLTIKMNKGTGVVMSVPSDSPDDWAAWNDLRKKPELRKKFGIAEEHVAPFEPLPIIRTPLGDRIAVTLCEEAKIQSQNDPKLSDLKDTAYLQGFDHGVMLVGGEFSGRPVKEIKPLVKEMMIREGFALPPYAEPEGLIMSRSGNECVVALSDQWYIEYGKGDAWQDAVRTHVRDTLETFGEPTKKVFQRMVEWLHEKACSRSSGLGTRLPVDPEYLIESLSDSTIYMAYYTVAHELQGDLDGSIPGRMGIGAEELTDEVWDYIFLSETPDDLIPVASTVPTEKLRALRSEFRYWYPVDLRVSGKDLLQNHLPMSVYNHAAIWEQEPELWPRAVFCNGFVTINNEKMSKSTGNFKTLTQAVQEYSADATRFALAEAGDTLEDCNFSEAVANSHVLRLWKELDWIKEFLTVRETGKPTQSAIQAAEAAAADPSDPAVAALAAAQIQELRSGPPVTFFDHVFENQIHDCIRKTREAFEGMQFRVGVQWSVHELLNARDAYRLAQQGSLNQGLLERFIDVLIILWSPICPHWTQYVHGEILRRKGLVLDLAWPEVAEVDRMLQRKSAFLGKVDRSFTQELRQHNQSLQRRAKHLQKKMKKKGQQEEEAREGSIQKTVYPSRGIIYTASRYPELHLQLIQLTQKLVLEQEQKLTEEHTRDEAAKSAFEALDSAKKSQALLDRRALGAALKGMVKGKKEIGAAMKFAAQIAEQYVTTGPEAFETEPAFDEAEFLREQIPFVTQHAAALSRAYDRQQFTDIRIETVDPNTVEEGSPGGDALPGQPSFVFLTE